MQERLLPIDECELCPAGEEAVSSPERPEWINNNLAIMQEAVEKMEKHVPFASASLIKDRHNRYEIRAGMAAIRKPAPETGIVLRAFDGRSFHEWSHNGLSFEALPIIAEDFAKQAMKHPGNGPEVELPLEAEANYHFVTPGDMDPFQISQEQKLAMLQDVYGDWKDRDKRVKSLSTSIDENKCFKVYVSSRRVLSQEIRIVNGMAMFYAADSKGGTSWDYHHFSADDYRNFSFEEKDLAFTMNRVLRHLDSRKLEPGSYQVVTDPHVSGIIAHEAFGHGVETDMFVKDRAKARDYMNQEVGSKLVNLYDDPTLRARPGSYFFDDEGQIASTTCILEQGVLKRGLTDLYSAALLKIPRTANGRRQDATRKVYARMSNTYFGPGTASRDDLISSVSSGLLLTGSGQGMEDPKEWGIQVEARFGEEIKNGRLTGRLYSGIAITGTVPGILGAVKGVSRDLQLAGGGGCGKGHKEIVKVSCGGPYMLTEARLG